MGGKRETSGRQAGDKWETSVKACGPERPEWNASRETKAKSRGPGTQPFERSKNPIQANLFGEKSLKRIVILMPKRLVNMPYFREVS